MSHEARILHLRRLAKLHSCLNRKTERLPTAQEGRKCHESGGRILAPHRENGKFCQKKVRDVYDSRKGKKALLFYVTHVPVHCTYTFRPILRMVSPPYIEVTLGGVFGMTCSVAHLVRPLFGVSWAQNGSNIDLATHHRGGIRALTIMDDKYSAIATLTVVQAQYDDSGVYRVMSNYCAI